MKAKKCHAFFVCVTFLNSSGTFYEVYHKTRWCRMGYNAAKTLWKIRKKDVLNGSLLLLLEF